MRKLFIIVNEDRFFLSHRTPIALAAMRDGYDVTIVTKDTGQKKEIQKLGFRVIDFPTNPTGMNLLQELRSFRFLLKLYKCEKPDIVHHVGVKNIVWGGVAAKITKINGIVNAVSGLGSLFNKKGISFSSRAVLSLMRFANKRSNVKVIFQNTDDISVFLKNKVVYSEQIEFTKGSGIDFNEYNYVEEPSDEKINVIFTARMIREKGVIDLIKAAESIKEEYKNKVKFILCGRLTNNKSGVSEKYLRDHCDGEYICWLGERNDVKQLLEKSHIMAFPSYYREGVPKSLIEAAAIGRPIITCNSTGCRDVVDNDVNGYLIEPQNIEELKDALIKLINNKQIRLKMGRESRKKAEREFSIDNVIDTHLKIYHTLCDN